VELDAGAAYRAWSSYRGQGATVRAFLAARLAVAPLGPLSPDLRSLRGRVLSLGCGHGLVERYLAEVNPFVTVDGVDLDRSRVAVANDTRARSPRVEIRVADVTRLEADGTYAAALAVDLLHHVPFEGHAAIVAAVFRCLEPGGAFLVKEMATTPRRQYLWNRFHDRIVAGPGPIYCRTPEDTAALLADTGFEVQEARRLKRIGIYPQYLVRARVPGSGAAGGDDPVRGG
jgi:2-polyprenyl-3-methyl-5-hydroxy-6-metoxy-1,4-benzoquinol methylase